MGSGAEVPSLVVSFTKKAWSLVVVGLSYSDGRYLVWEFQFLSSWWLRTGETFDGEVRWGSSLDGWVRCSLFANRGCYLLLSVASGAETIILDVLLL